VNLTHGAHGSANKSEVVRAVAGLFPTRLRYAAGFALTHHGDVGESFVRALLLELTESGSASHRARLFKAASRHTLAIGVTLDPDTDPNSIREVLIEREYDAPGYVAESGDLVIDVGAQHGEFSILNAVLRGARVIAFEPVASNCRVFRRNCELNHVSGVELREIALGAREGLLRGQFYGGMFVRDHLGRMARSEKVAATTLDSSNLLDLASGRQVILKIDAEGSESEILSGAVQFLRLVTPRLIIEVDHASESSLREKLAAVGYEIEITRRKSFSSLIFAREASARVGG